MHYNYCKIHKTLRVTPAMEAGLTDHVWNHEEIIALLAADDQPTKRGTTKSVNKFQTRPLPDHWLNQLLRRIATIGAGEQLPPTKRSFEIESNKHPLQQGQSDQALTTRDVNASSNGSFVVMNDLSTR